MPEATSGTDYYIYKYIVNPIAENICFMSPNFITTLGIIAVVAKSRKPKSARLKANVSYGSAQPSSGQSVIFHYACPNCSRKLQPPTSPNAGQKCQSCGWDSYQI